MFCEYLGTDGLSNQHEGEGSIFQDVESTGRLGKLGGLYSHFRPLRPEVKERVERSHPAGGEMYPNGSRSRYLEATGEEDLVNYPINLEPHELFSQLIAVTNLVKVGPRRGVFLSCVNVGDGVMRIWRDWLAEQSKLWKKESIERENSSSNHLQEQSKGTGTEQARRTGLSEPKEEQRRMLWVDDKKTVGVKVRVKEKKWNRAAPILIMKDDEAPVSYAIEIEGKSIK